MEAKFTPEYIVENAVRQTAEAAQITAEALKPLVMPLLRTFSLWLDVAIRNFDCLKLAYPVTGFLKYKVWEEKYKQSGLIKP